MPIYEYQCQACSEKLEALQKITDAPLVECPNCGEQSLRKLVSAAAFRLKGGGWYETDFKTGSKKNLAGSAEGKAGSAGDGKAGAAGDSKPATKDAGVTKSKASDSNSAA
ncbi:zinc ribbon domain-containing protein [Halieaceae bacterium]|nr:zinc ribbon domain-containing protein [Halieaceae bacterium]